VDALGSKPKPMTGSERKAITVFRRLLILALCTVGLTAGGPGSAHAAYYFVYDKQSSSINGYIVGTCDYSACWPSAAYRAGSGNGGKDGCQYANWIPNGTYSIRFHEDHYDGTIKGRVWYLSDHYCSSNGVTRTELFVHSEETQDQGQLCGSPYYNEHYCWDGDVDYYSLGCIKVARRPVHSDGYSDLGRVDQWYHWYLPSLVYVVS
jgi:hypothetical protein